MTDFCTLFPYLRCLWVPYTKLAQELCVFLAVSLGFWSIWSSISSHIVSFRYFWSNLSSAWIYLDLTWIWDQPICWQKLTVFSNSYFSKTRTSGICRNSRVQYNRQVPVTYSKACFPILCHVRLETRDMAFTFLCLCSKLSYYQKWSSSTATKHQSSHTICSNRLYLSHSFLWLVFLRAYFNYFQSWKFWCSYLQ